VLSAKSISAVSPASGAGTVTLTLATPGGAAKSHFTFVAVPGGPQGGSGGGQPASTASVGSGASGAGGGVLGFGPLCNASLLSRTLTVLGNKRAAIKLRWRGAGNCAGTLKLSVRVKAGKHIRTKTIGTGTFTIGAGRTRTVTVKLNGLGRSLLAARHGRLNASLLISSVSGHASSARTSSVRLAVPKPTKAKSKGK
jgi:hypothetical protein